MGEHIDIDPRKLAEREHNALTFIGLRAQAAASGLIQLCAELRAVGVLSEDAVDRIKNAIVDDLSVSMPRCRQGGENEAAIKTRMDTIFDRRIQATHMRGPIVGTPDSLGHALGLLDKPTAQ